MTPEQARKAWYRAIVRKYGQRGAKAHWCENRLDLLTSTPELQALYWQYLDAIEAARRVFCGEVAA